MRWIGIDFGAKLAGTTAITFLENNHLQTVQSEKKKDADKFCNSQVSSLHPDFIMIDAPLSLPLAYFGKGDDYFYREADRELKAMSPLFLGGLTARAMQLAAAWRKQNILVYECYPRMIEMRAFGLSSKNKIALEQTICTFLAQKGIGIAAQSFLTAHALDSVLAWISGYRLAQEAVIKTGNPLEGEIYT